MSARQERIIAIHDCGLPAHAVDLYLRGRAGASGIVKCAIGEIRGDLGARQDAVIREAVAELCAAKYEDGTPYLLHDQRANVFYFPKAAKDCPPKTRAHLEARRRFGRVPDCEPRRRFLAELAELAERFPDDPASLDGAARDALAGEQLSLGLGQDAPTETEPAPAKPPAGAPLYQPLIDAVGEVLPEVMLPRAREAGPETAIGKRLQQVWQSKAGARGWSTYLQAVRQLSLVDGCLHFGDESLPVTLELLLREGVCDAVLRMARAGPGVRR